MLLITQNAPLSFHFSNQTFILFLSLFTPDLLSASVRSFHYSCASPLRRISPSDGDSVVSDRSSERESTEENLRGLATPGDGKHSRKVPINVLNGKWPPPGSTRRADGGAGGGGGRADGDKRRAAPAFATWLTRGPDAKENKKKGIRPRKGKALNH